MRKLLRFSTYHSSFPIPLTVKIVLNLVICHIILAILKIQPTTFYLDLAFVSTYPKFSA